jgi:hypothetical protein
MCSSNSKIRNLVTSAQSGSVACPPSCAMGTRGVFPQSWGGRGMNPSTHLHPVPRWRMWKLHLHSLIYPHGIRDNFTFTYSYASDTFEGNWSLQWMTTWFLSLPPSPFSNETQSSWYSLQVIAKLKWQQNFSSKSTFNITGQYTLS